jgi:ATPase family associated with various cellular activities (AAA)
VQEQVVQESQISLGEVWLDKEGRPPEEGLPPETVVGIREFLGVSGDGDLVAWHWRGAASAIPRRHLMTRDFIAGKVTGGRLVRWRLAPASDEYVDGRYQSILYCRADPADRAAAGDAGARAVSFVVVDCWGERCVLCRKGDLSEVNDVLAEYLRSDNGRGRVWKGGYTQYDGPWDHIDDDRFVWPEGLREEALRNTIGFLKSKKAALVGTWGVRAQHGVLLHGLPGNGKTALVRLLVRDALKDGINVAYVDFDDGKDEGIGRLLESVVDDLGPVLIVFEEMDIRATRSPDSKEAERFLKDLTGFLDGSDTQGAFAFLGTANDKDRIAEKLLRKGRLGVQIEIQGPTPEQAKTVFESQVRIGPGRDEWPTEPAGLDDLIEALFEGETPCSFADVVEAATQFKLAVIERNNRICWDPDALKQVADDIRSRGVEDLTLVGPGDDKAGEDE